MNKVETAYEITKDRCIIKIKIDDEEFVEIWKSCKCGIKRIHGDLDEDISDDILRDSLLMYGFTDVMRLLD